MKQILLVFTFLSVLIVPLLVIAYNYRGVAGYDCLDKPEFIKKQYAECTPDIRTTQGAMNCAGMVTVAYCKKPDTATSQNKKVSLN